MSSFMCNDYHISALAYFLCQSSIVTGTPERMAATMQETNHTALYFRYGEGECPRHVPQDMRLMYDKRGENLTRLALSIADKRAMIQLYRAFGCYDYQCWEFEAYTNRMDGVSIAVKEAKEMLERILAESHGLTGGCEQICKTPEYKDSQWEMVPDEDNIPDPEPF